MAAEPNFRERVEAAAFGMKYFVWTKWWTHAEQDGSASKTLVPIPDQLRCPDPDPSSPPAFPAFGVDRFVRIGKTSESLDGWPPSVEFVCESRPRSLVFYNGTDREVEKTVRDFLAPDLDGVVRLYFAHAENDRRGEFPRRVEENARDKIEACIRLGCAVRGLD